MRGEGNREGGEREGAKGGERRRGGVHFTSTTTTWLPLPSG